MPPQNDTTDPASEETTARFCGPCVHFEIHPLGGGGECHRGRDCAASAAKQECPDRHVGATGSGPLFDMSE